MHRHSLEEVIEMLEKHVLETERINEELAADYINNRPGVPLPYCIKSGFNLALALQTICVEIIDLKMNQSLDLP